ncbi:hypothetical protein [Saccharopolyspora taberi]|uniref:Uncharacterized protein n=1 Tax=Saccharopolyspora taberi TaxID=60895 RepID=A0ABN3VDZ7_9PSEU
MNEFGQDRIAAAHEALSTAAAQPRPEGDPVAVLSELSAVAALLGELAGAEQSELAEWGTVGPHLDLARQHAEALARSLRHASGTLSYNRELLPAA